MPSEETLQAKIMLFGLGQNDRVSITVQPGIAGLRGGEVLGRVSSLRESVVPMWQGLSLAGQF